MTEQSILIVDDEQEVVSVLEDFFREEKFRVFVATSGISAKNHIESSTVDLVILDMRMPELDGPALLRIINQRRPATKVIILTGYGEQYKDEVKGLRFEAFVTKPFSATDLVQTAKNIIAGRPSRPDEHLALYNDPTILPVARLLFIELNELAFSGKRLYFSDIERCGGSYQLSVSIGLDHVLEKVQQTKPDIVLADISLLGKSDDARSIIAGGEHKPKDMIAYGKTYAGKRGALMVEGQFDPLTAIFAKGIMDKLGKVVRETCIRNGLYQKSQTPVKVPGLDLGKRPAATDAPHKPVLKDDIPKLVTQVLVNELKVPQDTIKETSRFVKDLGVDSLNSVRIVIALEEKLLLDIPDDVADQLHTVKQLITYLQKRTGE